MRKNALLLVALAGCARRSTPENASPSDAGPSRVIIFVWDGLRPDSVSRNDTPNLVALASEGVEFADHHATYPTFTMMNAASFATGGYPGTTGFYGNSVWVGGPADAGVTSAGGPVDLSQPLFTEDQGALDALDRFYGGSLLRVPTLFERAHQAGLRTAAIGKVGATDLLDHRRGGILLDERFIWPREFAERLRHDGLPVPQNSFRAFPAGTFDGGTENPTASPPFIRMRDGVTGDPSVARYSPNDVPNAYLFDVFLREVLPELPALSTIWLRSPDTTQHAYGPGTPAARDALRAQDALLGRLRAALAVASLAARTDVLVVSDHGHSTVSGPLSLFPLRRIEDGAPGPVDEGGWSVSGDVRTVDLLARAGLGVHAYDGSGCTDSPLLSGIRADGTPVFPAIVCEGQRATSPAARVPQTLGPREVVVVAGGGSEYVYVPSHERGLLEALVRFFQSRTEYGPVFVARRYGEVPGTLPLDAIRAETPDGARAPDLIVSFAWDAEAQVQGMRGIEFESAQNARGMHGSFSPVDVHNTLIAAGPHFRKGFRDPLPSGNVDLAPTVARILSLDLPGADGRVLEEALAGGPGPEAFQVTDEVRTSSMASGLRFALPTDPGGLRPIPGLSRYRVVLHARAVRRGAARTLYFDWSRAFRD